MSLISGIKVDVSHAVSEAKEDMAKQVKAGVDPLHERINRVRDEYVRRDDLDSHLARLDKRMDEINMSVQRSYDHVERRFDDLMQELRKRG